MPQHQDVPFNVTGTEIEHYAQEGRASSITSIEVHAWNESDDAASEFTPSGSIDSVNTTFDANSGVSSANPRLCNLAATTSIVQGRNYRATTTDGRWEWVDVVGISSGVSVLAREPLFNDYVSGDTFVGTRLYFTVDATWIADESNVATGLHHPTWRVRWEYVVDSTTYVAYTGFDVVRYPAYHRVNADSIEDVLPGFMNSLPLNHRDDQAKAFIAESYRQVRLDLYQERIDDAAVRDADVMDELVIKKSVQRWAETRALTGGIDDGAVALAHSMYWDRFNSLFKAPTQAKAPISTDSEGAGSYKAPARITVR